MIIQISSKRFNHFSMWFLCTFINANLALPHWLYLLDVMLAFDINNCRLSCKYMSEHAINNLHRFRLKVELKLKSKPLWFRKLYPFLTLVFKWSQTPILCSVCIDFLIFKLPNQKYAKNVPNPKSHFRP